MKVSSVRPRLMIRASRVVEGGPIGAGLSGSRICVAAICRPRLKGDESMYSFCVPFRRACLEKAGGDRVVGRQRCAGHDRDYRR